MARFLARRLVAGLITLVLLSIVIFFATQVLPGDVGRRVLGPFASEESVENLNRQLGADKALPTQYLNWMKGVVSGDLGTSVVTGQPVSALIGTSLQASLKLALLAFVIVVPVGVLGGVFAALHEGGIRDRLISAGGLAATAVPEFVWATLLILVFALGFGVLPATAQAPDGAGVLPQLEHLLLPALTLVFVLFGYIARMARAGTIEVLNADYTRTAALKGIPPRAVLRRHVLRNALLPTISVIATQVGYLIGGLLVVELIFNYNGIGQVMFRALQQKDFPVLQSTTLLIGAIYLAASLAADVLFSILNPRVRLGAHE